DTRAALRRDVDDLRQLANTYAARAFDFSTELAATKAALKTHAVAGDYVLRAERIRMGAYGGDAPEGNVAISGRNNVQVAAGDNLTLEAFNGRLALRGNDVVMNCDKQHALQIRCGDSTTLPVPAAIGLDKYGIGLQAGNGSSQIVLRPDRITLQTGR